MKNKMEDLNNHLFAQLERLGEEGLTAEQIQMECARSKSIADISDRILKQKEIELEAVKLFAEYNGKYLTSITQEMTECQILKSLPMKQN